MNKWYLSFDLIVFLRILFFCFFGFFFCLFRAIPVAYGSSQVRGQIEAVATSLCHSHSNTGSQLHLQPTPQLKEKLDATEQAQGSNLCPCGY